MHQYSGVSGIFGVPVILKYYYQCIQNDEDCWNTVVWWGNLLAKWWVPCEYPGHSLVFANSISCIICSSELLKVLDIMLLILPSCMHQKQRLRNLEQFAHLEDYVLLAIDMAAQGNGDSALSCLFKLKKKRKQLPPLREQKEQPQPSTSAKLTALVQVCQ
ncbi:ATP-dependent RNA helicase DDX24 [Tupaia chinensis]|uniref:ATP-dependent RNA helicase DDX24 n=1 Tax=Tupaia chinensis TaxID=246437 RepID=L9L1V0_TUPCH|nr:ATP-dependent RNA helicase DDX24 [Tupaia chinensis]